MKRTRLAASLLVTIVLGALGCSEEGTDTPPGTIGDTGYGIFHYVCIDEGDAVCVCNDNGVDVCAPATPVDLNAVSPDLGVSGQIPASIAVGGRFDLDYYGPLPDGMPVEIVPACTDVVSTTGGYRFTSPATVAFLARNPQGITADFVHVSASAIEALDVWWSEQRVQSFDLEQPGAETVVAVLPVDADGVSLAGSLSYTWSISDEAVALLAPVGSVDPPDPGMVITTDEVRVVGMAEGEAVLSVEVEDFSAQVTVTVGPEVLPE